MSCHFWIGCRKKVVELHASASTCINPCILVILLVRSVSTIDTEISFAVHKDPGLLAVPMLALLNNCSSSDFTYILKGADSIYLVVLWRVTEIFFLNRNDLTRLLELWTRSRVRHAVDKLGHSFVILCNPGS